MYLKIDHPLSEVEIFIEPFYQPWIHFSWLFGDEVFDIGLTKCTKKFKVSKIDFINIVMLDDGTIEEMLVEVVLLN